MIKKKTNIFNRGKLKDKRLDKFLGDNELREYLAHKEETGIICRENILKTDFRDYKKPKSKDINVLLIASPITIPKYMQKRCIPPLGLSYIAASLEEADISVSMIDSTVEGYDNERYTGNLMTYGLSPDQLEKKLQNYHPDVVGLSVLFSTDMYNLFETSRVVRKVFPETEIVVGGLHPTIYPKEVFELDMEANGFRTIDWIIRGEGEYRMIDFVKNLKEGKIDKNADGLAGFFNGKYFCNHQVVSIENLDSIPFPAYHLLPMEKYFEINVPFSPVPQGNRVCQILISRGCPIGCTFCASTNLYKKYRYRSIENVIGEIRKLKTEYNIDEIQFADDNLTFKRSYSKEFFTALKDENLLWCTPNGTMINTLTPDLMDIMAKSGLYQITLSIDSGSTKTLKKLHNKPVKLNTVPGIISKAKEYGIFTHGTFVVGMPGETVEDIQEGFNYIKDNFELTSISTFIAAPIPGSELYHKALEEEIVTKEDARSIDTTKCKISLSDIDGKTLENMIMRFQEEYTEAAKKRDPEEYNRKYGKLLASGKMKGFYGGRLT